MNINFTDLEKLINIAENSNINSLEVVDGDQRIHIVCHSHDNNNNETSNNSDPNTVSSSSKQQNSSEAYVDEKNAESTNTNVNRDSKTEVEPKNQITAPMLGTFYRRSEPTADEFVKVGDAVSEGQTLCVIEAMKIMHEVKADSACTIKEILINEGDIVEYAQPLFAIETST